MNDLDKVECAAARIESALEDLDDAIFLLSGIVEDDCGRLIRSIKQSRACLNNDLISISELLK